MAATKTYQGYTYEQRPDGSWVRQGGATVTPMNPYAGNDESRKAEDQEFDRARIDLARQQAANSNRSTDNTIANSSQANAIAAEKATRDRIEWEAKFNPDGTPKPLNNAKASSRATKLQTLIQQLDRVQDLYSKNLYGGLPNQIVGRVPGLLRPENEQFTAAASGMAEQGLSAFRVPGVGSQSDTELRQFVEANKPLATDSDLAIEEKLRTVRLRAESELGSLGLDKAGEPTPQQTRENLITNIAAGAAGEGATAQTTPIPPEMQGEYDAFMANWVRNPDPDAYVRKRAELDMKYGYGDNADKYRSFAETTAENLKNGGAVLNNTIPGVETPLEGLDKVANDIVSNPFGTAAASYANAAGLGIPTVFARDQMQAMRDLNPVSAFGGEVVGGLTGTLGASAALKGISKAANPTVASLLSNPLAADVAYGGIYGATQSDDPLLGALGGAGAGYIGNKIGGAITKRLPGLAGVKKPKDTLSRAERGIAKSIPDVDPVIEQLMQAEQLGVPGAIADFAPGVNKLTGGALRKSPEASGMARDVLFRRGQGQVDRFNSAIARDLGPISNVPQVSDDLMAQAKVAAGPLYDEAYAAPGVSAVNIDDLLQRPTFKAALQQGYAEAADSGVDPSSLGFDLDEFGEVILGQTPSWRSLDYAKRGLDNVIESNTTTLDGMNAAGGRATAMKGDLLRRMDSVNPAYTAARAAYAGPASARSALRRGQQAINDDPNQLGVDINKAGQAEVDQMRLGFQSGLSDKANKYSYGTNPFNSALNNPAMELRLAAIYGDDANIAQLLLQRDMEGKLAASTNALIGNSQSAEKLAADAMFAEQSMGGDILQGALETAVTGAPVATAMRSAAGRGIGAKIKDYRQYGSAARAKEFADEIVPIALETNPAQAAATLQDIMGRSDAYQAILDELLGKAAVRGSRGGASTLAATNAAIQR